MRVLAGAIVTETNSFSNIPTTLESFRETALFYGDGSRHNVPLGDQLALWRERCAAEGHDYHESVLAFAQPAGPTQSSAYLHLRDRLVSDVAAARPDCVLLVLHGAMVATDQHDDCEGDILRAVRECAGPDAVVGAVLDPHCHLTSAMLENADLLCFMKEYPHSDGLARAADLFRLALATSTGAVRPCLAARAVPVVRLWPTQDPLMRGLIERCERLEEDGGALSVSFVHGFPWGDVADVGSAVLAITDDDPAGARAIVDEIAASIWEARERAGPTFISINEAVERGRREPGLTILADVSDNPGGGAPGDSTFILEHLVRRSVESAVVATIFDPQATAFAHAVGAGGQLQLRVGGKTGPASGAPLDLDCEVVALRRNYDQTFLDGVTRSPMGDAAWLKSGGIDIIINSVRTQVFHPDAITGLGLDPTERSLVVVKSTNHFYGAFRPLASEILFVGAPGALTPDYGSIPYTKFGGRYWPREDWPVAPALPTFQRIVSRRGAV
ncbi:M81 family metallopeptidase [Sphingomonas sp. CCH18-H6]|uniref:M81 family metallopeptidase n=1 Tax=Sphingomonas sp. CCH18-H6 TaxID=1768787 RepID=UPI00082E391C|nr:M81 family metallopeptidase [Sphingomonas sp. CCH18-H6]